MVVDAGSAELFTEGLAAKGGLQAAGESGAREIGDRHAGPLGYFGTPVVLVSSLNEDGSHNVAPISSAWWLGRSCLLGFGARSKTPANLLRTGECVLNLPSVKTITRRYDVAEHLRSPEEMAAYGDVHALLKVGILEKTREAQIVFPFDAVHVNFFLKTA